MICKNCPYRKENDAIKEMDDGVSWFCTKKHSECEDITCLLRMLIWELYHLEDKLD
jgi:hypothetical protein